jgi:hypothetical protein
MPDHESKVRASQAIFDMIKVMIQAQQSGGFTQDTMLLLMKKWIFVGIYFDKGGDPKREGQNYFTFAKGAILEDYKADPNATPPVQSFESIGHAPKASVEFYKKLSNLANQAYSDNMIQRGYAFNDAEGAFLVMIMTYRIKLAADKRGEQEFRQKVNRLRSAHSL